jgi:hypothetical protein
MEAPSFLRRPLAVRGIPIFRDTRDLKADIPRNRFHENPPEFIQPPALRLPVCDYTYLFSFYLWEGRTLLMHLQS